MFDLSTIQNFIQTFEHIDHCQIYHSSSPHLLLTCNFECSHLSGAADKLCWWVKEWGRWCFKCTDTFLSKRRIREGLFTQILLIQSRQCGVDNWWAEGGCSAFSGIFRLWKVSEAERCTGAQFLVLCPWLRAAGIYDPSFDGTSDGLEEISLHRARPGVTCTQLVSITPSHQAQSAFLQFPKAHGQGKSNLWSLFWSVLYPMYLKEYSVRNGSSAGLCLGTIQLLPGPVRTKHLFGPWGIHNHIFSVINWFWPLVSTSLGQWGSTVNFNTKILLLAGTGSF